MTLPPNGETPKNPADEPEFVVPDAALPEEPAEGATDAVDPATDPGPDATPTTPVAPTDPLAPSTPPASGTLPVGSDTRTAYTPPVYAPPPSQMPTAASQQPGSPQPVYSAAQQPGAPVPPVPPAAPGAQYSAQQPEPPKKTNVLAIVSFISAFFISVLAIILGHISLSQIKKTGEGGRGLALAGTILGYVFSFGWILIIIGIFASAAMFASNVDSLEAEIQRQLEQLEESGDLPDGALPFDEDGTGEEDRDVWQDPWIGTENEAFCDAWDVYPEDGDEHKYLQDVADAAPNTELTELWQGLADEWQTSANESEDDFNAFWERYYDADVEAEMLCYSE